MINRDHPYNILVVGDKQSNIEQVVEQLRHEYTVFHVHSKDKLSSTLQNGIALVIADQRVLGQSQQDVLNTVETSPEVLWIILGKQSDSNFFMKAIQEGIIYQFIHHAWQPEEIYTLAKRALEHYHLIQKHEKIAEELQQFNKELVHSEKMVTLGQMVAGVAHEINTPSAAINAAIGNMNHHLKLLLENCWRLDKQGVTREHLRQILQIVANMLETLDEKPRRTSSEVRTEQKGIVEKLAQQNIQDSRKIAKDIARIGLTEDLDEFLALAALYGMESMLSFFSHCSRIISAAKDITFSINMLTRFVRALKSYSYPWQETPEFADIHDSIDTALIILNNKLKHRIRADFCPGDVPKILCYSSELSQVWLNLIHNAIQAIEGEGEITITTSATAQYVTVKITDTGGGIPEDIQPQIFDTNFTTKSREEGTGLGLYLARKIIEKHGGTITFSSIPGKTTFKVQLPIHGYSKLCSFEQHPDKIRRNDESIIPTCNK